MTVVFLGNPLLPINVPVEKALGNIKAVLLEKNWKEPEIGTGKLILVPYFFFKYHYFSEIDKGTIKIVASSKDGVLALDASTLKLDDDATKLISYSKDNHVNTAPKSYVEKEMKIEKREVDEVLKFKVAELFSVPKQNVVISNPKRYFIPFYEFSFTLNNEKCGVIVNAVDGAIKGTEKLPVREKGALEVTRETLIDLSSPKGWIEYSKGLFKETGKTLSQESAPVKKGTPEIKLSFLSSKLVIIAIIIFALFLIFLAFFN